jgi:tetratricopeptide (TPR) repeat protein
MKKSLALIFSVLLLAGCGNQNYQAEKEFWKAEKAMKLLTKKDLQEKGPSIMDPVIKQFEDVYEKYPGTPKASESLFVISNLRIRQNKFAEAVEALEKIVQNYSDQKAAEARYGIAQLYEYQKNWDKAEAAYWDTAEYHPFHQKGLYSPVHVIIHYKKTKEPAKEKKAFDRALDYYNRMLKQVGPIQPAGAIKNYLGLAYLAHGKWEEARDTWVSIPDQFPESPYAPLSLLAGAELSWKRKDLDNAIKYNEDFLKRYPKHSLVSKTKAQIGIIYQDKKEYAKSREWFEKALENQKEMSALADLKLLIGRSFQEEGKWEEAEKFYAELESKYPKTTASLQVPLMRSAYYQQKGDTANSEKILNEAIARYETMSQGKENPALADYAVRLQNAALAEKGDWNTLISNFDKNIEKETSSVKKGNWLFLKGLIIENRMGKKKEALSVYQDFLKKYPEHPLAKTAKSREGLLLKTI